MNKKTELVNVTIYKNSASLGKKPTAENVSIFTALWESCKYFLLGGYSLPQRIIHAFYYPLKGRSGGCIKTHLSSDNKMIGFMVERRIEPSCVKNGKLLNDYLDIFKQRGHKRTTGQTLSIKEAKALEKALGQAIAKAEEEQKKKACRTKIANLSWLTVN